MRCPYCGHDDSRVTDSRSVDDGVRRRRECSGCGARFTPMERVQRAGLLIIKKDGRREEFNREKVLMGVRKACAKRPIPASAMEALADQVEAACYAQGRAEIPSSFIGGLVMEKLRELDHIAYMRFASVYQAFADLDELKAALLALEHRREGSLPGQLPLLAKEESRGYPAAAPHPRRASAGPSSSR